MSMTAPSARGQTRAKASILDLSPCSARNPDGGTDTEEKGCNQAAVAGRAAAPAGKLWQRTRAKPAEAQRLLEGCRREEEASFFSLLRLLQKGLV